MPRGSEKEKKYKSELMVVVVAQDLLDETLRLLCKEELFPKKSRWLMGQDIARVANQFLDMVVYANGIIVDTPELAKERHNAQRRAVAWCKEVLNMFKKITAQEQLIKANAEIARLRATVGELPPQETIEGEEAVEQPKLVDRVVTVEETIETLFGGVE